MQHREPIFHDRQKVESAVPQSTTSLTFVDVTGAALTTKDLGQEGTYQIMTPVLVQSSLNNTIASFRITADGDQIGDISIVELKIKELDVGITFVGELSGVSAGTVLQMQYATDKGTLTLEEYSVIFDGIPSIRVIQ